MPNINVKGAIVPNTDAWIYEWLSIEHTCPKNVAEKLDEAAGEQVDVYINSGGGDIFAASEIYAAIQAYKGTVKNHVVGLAASAASVIACAAKCDMAPTAMMMVHNVSSYAAGDYHDMDKQSETLQKANQTIAAAYCAKAKMTEQEALAMMDKETWLSAKDAVERGLVDELAVSQNQNVRLAASVGGILPEAVLQMVRNTVKPPEITGDFIHQKMEAELKFLKLGGKIA